MSGAERFDRLESGGSAGTSGANKPIKVSTSAIKPHRIEPKERRRDQAATIAIPVPLKYLDTACSFNKGQVNNTLR